MHITSLNILSIHFNHPCAISGSGLPANSGGLILWNSPKKIWFPSFCRGGWWNCWLPCICFIIFINKTCCFVSFEVDVIVFAASTASNDPLPCSRSECFQYSECGYLLVSPFLEVVLPYYSSYHTHKYQVDQA